MQLLAVDPGETIGWCWFEDSRPIRWGQFSWCDLARLKQLLDAPTPDRLVVERFSLYRMSAGAQVNSEFPAVQVIGMLRLLAWERGLLLDTQPASMIHHGGQIIPPLRRDVDHYLPRTSMDCHARDAMAHGVAWWRRHASTINQSA